MRRPSADVVAGNGRPLSWAPSADAVAGRGNWEYFCILHVLRQSYPRPDIASAWEQPIEERDCQCDAGQ
jgi:hypothetical protein